MEETLGGIRGLLKPPSGEAASGDMHRVGAKPKEPLPSTGRDINWLSILSDSEGPLKLSVESSSFIVGICDGFIICRAPGELKPDAERLIEVPEQIGIDRAIERPPQSRGRIGNIIVDRIVASIARMRVQAGSPIVERLQPAAGCADTFQRIGIDFLEDSSVVGAEGLTGIDFARDAEAVCHLPTRVDSEAPYIGDDTVDALDDLQHHQLTRQQPVGIPLRRRPQTRGDELGLLATRRTPQRTRENRLVPLHSSNSLLHIRMRMRGPK